MCMDCMLAYVQRPAQNDHKTSCHIKLTHFIKWVSSAGNICNTIYSMSDGLLQCVVLMQYTDIISVIL